MEQWLDPMQHVLFAMSRISNIYDGNVERKKGSSGVNYGEIKMIVLTTDAGKK